MPRGHKSKLRARERRRQARSEAHASQSTLPTAAEEEEMPSSSSHLFGGHPQRSPDAGSHSRRRNEEIRSTFLAWPNTHSVTDQIDSVAILLVQFILHKYNMREPITKKEILKHVITENKALFPEILKTASELMVLAFGIEVKEVDPINHCYVLVSKLNASGTPMVYGEAIMPRSGLLMTILCVIFMNGKSASEDSVWEVLNVMGIYEGVYHPVYGDAKRLITQDLVRERYLEYRRVLNSDPPRYHFLWGPRANRETSKMRVLEFLAKVHNTVPSAFPSWYEEALRDEEERILARVATMLLNSAMASVQSMRRFHSSSHLY